MALFDDFKKQHSGPLSPTGLKESFARQFPIRTQEGEDEEKPASGGLYAQFRGESTFQPPEPNLTQHRALDLVPGTLEVLEGLQKDPFNLDSVRQGSIADNLIDIPEAMWESLKRDVSENVETIANHFQSGQKGKTISQAVGDTAKVIAAGGGLLFSPITALFEGAKEVPVLGSVARVVEFPFATLGETGALAGGTVIDILPVSDEAKDDMREGVEELFALAAQIAGGKAVEVVVRKSKPRLEKRFGKPDAETILKEAKKLGERKKNLVEGKAEGKETTLHDRFLKEEGAPLTGSEARRLSETDITLGEFQEIFEARARRAREGIDRTTDVGQSTVLHLPERDVFARIEPEVARVLKDEVANVEFSAKDIVHLSQFEKVRGKVKEVPLEELTKLSDNAKQTIANAEAIISKEGITLREIERPGGEVRQRGLSRGVEAQAVEKKITRGFDELPEFETVDLAAQSKRATEFLIKEPQRAKRVALGREAPPPELIPEMVFRAVEELALQNRDVVTLRDLAVNSELTKSATVMGQRIRALGERNPDSPVRALQEIADVREKVAKKRTKNIKQQKTGEIKKAKQEIKKAAPTKDIWKEFINDIKC